MFPPEYTNFTEVPEERSIESQNNTWLDSLVISNPHGVMQALAKNGYVGYLAPQDNQELIEASQDFIEKKGETAVVALLKVHPLYDVIADISRQSQTVPINFKNADGSVSSVITTIKTIDYKKVIETLLVIIGGFYLANKLWGLLTKE